MRVLQEEPAGFSDGSDDDGATTGGSRHHRKIEIAYIRDKQKRHISFSKRKAGIFKKAHELATLTGTQILLLIVSETGLVYTYTTDRLQPLVTAKEGQYLIQTCLSTTPSASPVSEEPLTPPSFPAHDDAVIHGMQSIPPLSLSPYSAPTYAPVTVAPSDMVLAHTAPEHVAPRTLKKRRTAENLRHGVKAEPDMAVLRRERLEQASRGALATARRDANLHNLMLAFQLHKQAEEDGSSRSDGGIGFTFSHLMLSMQTCIGSQQIDAQSAGADQLSIVFSDFVQRYLPSAFDDPASASCVSSLLDDLRGWVRWLHGEQWLDASQCSSLLRQMGPATPRRIASNARLRRAASAGNIRAPAKEEKPAPALLALQSYVEYVRTTYPGELFDASILSGSFTTVVLGNTFALLEPSNTTPGKSDETLTVIKVQLPGAVTALLKKDDVLSLTVQRVLGDASTAHWLPTTCTGYIKSSGENVTAYLPTTHDLHTEMQAAQEIDDQLAFADAYRRWQKAMRIENLLAQGELLADGYGETTANNTHPTFSASTLSIFTDKIVSNAAVQDVMPDVTDWLL